MKDDLGDRIKSFYEDRNKTYLLRRTPVIIRIDGRAFHSFCKRFEKPYDGFLNQSLNNVMLYLCKNIQGVKMAERHSDEISLLLIDYDDINTDSFFDYNVQKICSISASMATSEFCRQLAKNSYKSYGGDYGDDWARREVIDWDENWPCFDSRCFNIPEKEIANYFFWRHLDAKRNSINMLAQSLFSHNELQDKTCNEMQEMLFQRKGINWGKLEGGRKAGFIAIKEKETKTVSYHRKDKNGGSECSPNPIITKEVERNIWKAIPTPETITKLRAVIKKVLPTETTETMGINEKENK